MNVPRETKNGEKNSYEQFIIILISYYYIYYLLY